jgi:peptidyl-prolyl cis-trans isomerase B (cyclophilin B)
METKMLKNFISIAFFSIACVVTVAAQNQTPAAKAESPAAKSSNKTNQRPVKNPALEEPFAKVTVAEMAAQCVKFDTEAGVIEMEMFPESAPQTVRSFLNLVAGKFLDTTTFSRVVPGFVVQGGNLSTHEKRTPEIDKRAWVTVPDEPNQIKHERGILSMARADAPNSATTNFFILVGEARHLDGVFTAFGRVVRGMDLIDAINKMPVEGDKPIKPVRLNKAITMPCPVKPTV